MVCITILYEFFMKRLGHIYIGRRRVATHDHPYSSRLCRLWKTRKNRHSEPASAGEQSLLVLYFELGVFLRVAQNDHQSTFSTGCFGGMFLSQSLEVL
jgi:hypothetical protein